MTAISRRTLLAGAAFGVAVGAVPDPGRAKVAASGRQVPGIYRYRLGAFELTAINDGVWHLPVDERFVRNAAFAQVQQAMADAFMPASDSVPWPFTAIMVNTGSSLVLIDTGTGGQIASTAGLLEANLAAAGVSAEAVDAIVISHFHPDHIDGIKTKDDAPVFPNAEILVPEPEWEFWMGDVPAAASETVKGYFLNAHRIFRNMAKAVRRYQPGREVVPGIISVPAPGHTPGHQAIAIASGDRSMLMLSDAATHPALFVRHPEWQVAFDMDGATAAETRKRLLDRAAAEKMLVAGYHFPFPACGHISRAGSGYEFHPVQWSPEL